MWTRGKIALAVLVSLGWSAVAELSFKLMNIPSDPTFYLGAIIGLASLVVFPWWYKLIFKKKTEESNETQQTNNAA